MRRSLKDHATGWPAILAAMTWALDNVDEDGFPLETAVTKFELDDEQSDALYTLSGFITGY